MGEKTDRISEIIVRLEENLPDYIYRQPLTLMFDIPLHWYGKPFILNENNAASDIFIVDSLQAQLSIVPDGKFHSLILVV